MMIREILTNENLTATERLVAVVLVDALDGAETCSPGHAVLTKRSKLVKSTVRRAVESLELKGVIRVARSVAGNRYEFVNHQ